MTRAVSMSASLESKSASVRSRTESAVATDRSRRGRRREGSIVLCKGRRGLGGKILRGQALINYLQEITTLEISCKLLNGFPCLWSTVYSETHIDSTHQLGYISELSSYPPFFSYKVSPLKHCHHSLEHGSLESPIVLLLPSTARSLHPAITHHLLKSPTEADMSLGCTSI